MATKKTEPIVMYSCPICQGSLGSDLEKAREHCEIPKDSPLPKGLVFRDTEFGGQHKTTGSGHIDYRNYHYSVVVPLFRSVGLYSLQRVPEVVYSDNDYSNLELHGVLQGVVTFRLDSPISPKKLLGDESLDGLIDINLRPKPINSRSLKAKLDESTILCLGEFEVVQQAWIRRKDFEAGLDSGNNHVINGVRRLSRTY
jgi:hypothetical protein